MGLIQSTELVPSYSLTISPGHEVSIQNFIAEKIDPSDWWEKVVTSDFSIPHLSQLADESDLLLVSLTSPYVRMLSSQLRELGRRVMIFTGDHSILDRYGLSSKSSPYTNAFDGRNCPVPGTKGDFAQRIHSDFISRLRAAEMDLEVAIKSVKNDMIDWVAPERKINKRLCDAEILHLIKRHKVKFSDIGSLHKFFRHDLGVACEQKRFSNLYRKLREEETCQ